MYFFISIMILQIILNVLCKLLIYATVVLLGSISDKKLLKSRCFAIVFPFLWMLMNFYLLRIRIIINCWYGSYFLQFSQNFQKKIYK